MTPKERAVAALQAMPANATWDEVAEKMAFMAAIERGLKDVEEGKVVANSEVKQRIREWLRK
jgi:predicted transcriptional regulator